MLDTSRPTIAIVPADSEVAGLVTALATILVGVGLGAIILYLGQAYLPALSTILIPVLMILALLVAFGIVSRGALELLSSEKLATMVRDRVEQLRTETKPA